LSYASNAATAVASVLNGLFSAVGTSINSAVSATAVSAPSAFFNSIISQFANALPSALAGIAANLSRSAGNAISRNNYEWGLFQRAVSLHQEDVDIFVAGAFENVTTFGANSSGLVEGVFLLDNLVLTDTDLAAFDNFLTAFGQSRYEVFNAALSSIQKTHDLYEFIQFDVDSLSIDSKPIKQGQQQISGLLENGIRIWHTAPNGGLLYNNNFVA